MESDAGDKLFNRLSHTIFSNFSRLTTLLNAASALRLCANDVPTKANLYGYWDRYAYELQIVLLLSIR